MGIFPRIFTSSLFWFGVLMIIALGAAFYLILGKGAEDVITHQLLNQRRTLARAEVSNITAYFEKFGDSVATMANLTSIQRRDADSIKDMETFIEQRRPAGFVGGVILMDTQGIIQFNYNITGTNDQGISFADRDFFIWAKGNASKGEYFISAPFVSSLGATKGETIIVVSSPVYQNNVFKGVIAATVRLQPVVERFIELMKVSDGIKVYLVSEGGNLLYNNFEPVEIGSHFSALFLDDAILRERIEEGLNAPQGDQFRTDRYLVAYSNANIGAQKWSLIIVSSVEETAVYTRPFYVRQTAMFVLTAFAILLFAVISFRRNRV